MSIIIKNKNIIKKISKQMNIYVIIVSILALFYLEPYLKKDENRLIKLGFNGSSGRTQNTLFLRIFGMKRLGCSLIWIDQIQNLAGNKNLSDNETINILKSNSDKMSYLDPYFIPNYTVSGSVLALIRIYQRYDLAAEIFQKGIKYNPKNGILKKYFSGIMAASKNDTNKTLAVFEDIVRESKDDLLTSTIAFMYEKKYEKSKRQLYLDRAIKYWKELLQSKNSEYVNIATKKLKKYNKI